MLKNRNLCKIKATRNVCCSQHNTCISSYMQRIYEQLKIKKMYVHKGIKTRHLLES